MRLERKLFLLLAALLVCAAGALTYHNYLQDTRDIDRDLQLAQRDKVAALARVSQDALIRGNDLALVDYAKIVKPLNEYAAWAAVINEKGETVAHTDPAEIGKTIPVALASTSPSPVVSEEGVYSVAIASGGRTIGWVRMAVDQEKLRAESRLEGRTAARHAWQVFAWALAIGLPFSFLVSWIAVRPLKRLVKSAQALSSGDLGARADAGSGDELGELASQVNEMAEKLYGATGTGHEDSLKLAHDLKSPLAAIQSYLYLIEEEPESKEEVRKNVEAVRASAQRLSQMVTDILEKERVLEGRGESNVTLLSVEDVLRSVHQEHRVEAEQRGLYLMEPGIPYGMPKVLANEDHLHRIVDNLVSNAIKYTPKDGSVWCEVEVKADEVWVMVNDTGLGMDPEEVPKLFQRFERGRSLDVQHKPGAGLGLFIAKELVEKMGGRIWAASRGKGQGSTIVFTLKAVFDEVPA